MIYIHDECSRKENFLTDTYENWNFYNYKNRSLEKFINMYVYYFYIIDPLL